MKKMKMVTGIVTGLVMAAMLMGCGSTKLADSFDSQTVEDEAKEVIMTLNDGDYKGVEEYFAQEMQTQLPADKLETTVAPILEKAGAFTEYKSAAVVGRYNKQTSQDNAVAVVVAQYANQKLTYTVSFDQDMNVNGLYMK